MKRSTHVVFGALLGIGALAASAGANAEPVAPAPPPPPAPWYKAIHFDAFADAYAQVNYNFPKPQTGQNAFRAYDTTNGFALSWVGLDASYDPAPVGGTLSLRFGPTAQIYAGADARYDLQYVKQAYASWKPFDALQLDFGKFDTIYGAEVAESQNNMNYTRGVLYWLAQPLFHTGLRANIKVAPMLSFNVLAVNGWNNTVDNNTGKTYGLQALIKPTDNVGIALGWIGGPEQSDSVSVDCPQDTAYDPNAHGCAPQVNTPAQSYTVDRGGANDFKAWKHLIDLVATYDATENLSFVFNADYGTEGVRSLDPNTQATDINRKRWYGAMLGARYQLTPVWAVAGRGEYYRDPQGYTTGTGYDISLATGTLTIEAKPTDNLILRLENRGDFAVGPASGSKDIFPKKVRAFAPRQITTTLGVVVTTN